jgi:hypothetical protein
MNKRVAKTESGDKVGAGDRCGMTQHLKNNVTNKIIMFSVSATCFKTSPFVFVNCNCAHDGLRTILHPSLNPHRNHPPNVAAASQALGLGMKQRDNADDGAASSQAKLDGGETKLCALEAFLLGSGE